MKQTEAEDDYSQARLRARRFFENFLTPVWLDIQFNIKRWTVRKFVLISFYLWKLSATETFDETQKLFFAVAAASLRKYWPNWNVRWPLEALHPEHSVSWDSRDAFKLRQYALITDWGIALYSWTKERRRNVFLSVWAAEGGRRL